MGIVVAVVTIAVVMIAVRGGDGTDPIGPPLSTAACLGRDDLRVVTGDQPDQLRLSRPPSALTVDLRDATFTGYPSSTDYPISLGKGAPARGLCMVGGVVRGSQPRELSWDEMKARFDGAAARVAGNEWYVVDGLRVDNVEDGIDPRGTEDRYPKDGDGFILRNLYFQYIRDDCVENDDIAGGLVEDSLFDGCYTGISERPTSGNPQFDHPAPQGEELRLRGVLLRLAAQPGPRGRSADEMGHGQLFKWSPVGNRLRIEDSVILVEQVPNRGRADFPPGTIAEDVTLVWLGDGPFPGDVPSGVRVTTDSGVWDRARARWLERHGCTSFDRCTRLTDPVAR